MTCWAFTQSAFPIVNHMIDGLPLWYQSLQHATAAAEHFSMSNSRVQVWLDSLELGGKLGLGQLVGWGQALKGLEDHGPVGTVLPTNVESWSWSILKPMHIREQIGVAWHAMSTSPTGFTNHHKFINQGEQLAYSLYSCTYVVHRSLILIMFAHPLPILKLWGALERLFLLECRDVNSPQDIWQPFARFSRAVRMSIFATRRKRLQHLGTEQRKSWVELQEYIGTKWGEYRIYTSQTYIVIGFLFYYFY